jgi:hypothetical protein
MPREGPLVEDRVSGMRLLIGPCAVAKQKECHGRGQATCWLQSDASGMRDGFLDIRLDGLAIDRTETIRVWEHQNQSLRVFEGCSMMPFRSTETQHRVNDAAVRDDCFSWVKCAFDLLRTRLVEDANRKQDFSETPWVVER